MSFSLLESECLDLVECGRKYKRRVGTRRFAAPVVAVADKTILSLRNRSELQGIRDCIRALLSGFKWNEGFVFLPVRQDLTWISADRIEFLANSVIATTMKYRYSLDESHTGLRSIIYSEFVQGLEWACSAVIRIGLVEERDGIPVMRKEDLVGLEAQFEKSDEPVKDA